MELTENRVWSIEISGMELAYFGVLQSCWRTLRNTYNVQVNKHRKDSRLYLSITNFKLLLNIFLPLEGTIQSWCPLYNESLYCQCRAEFHWTRRLHVAAECHCPVLDATLDTFQQPNAHGEINLSYLLTEGMADGWLDKLLRICLIAEPWTDRQVVSQTGWLTEWLCNRPSKIPAGWLTDRQTDWLIDWPSDWFTYYLT